MQLHVQTWTVHTTRHELCILQECTLSSHSNNYKLWQKHMNEYHTMHSSQTTHNYAFTAQSYCIWQDADMIHAATSISATCTIPYDLMATNKTKIC